MKILFLATNICPIHSGSAEERPLRGTLSALIFLAKALHERGVDVRVVTEHPAPPPSEPPYLPIAALNSVGPFDVLIAVREWTTVFLPLQYRKCFYWTGDNYTHLATLGIGDPRVISRLDGFFAKSEWHKKNLCGVSGYPEEKAFVLRNGIHPPYYEGSEKRRRKRLIYASHPKRGLKHLASLFPMIKKKHPDAELYIFSGKEIYSSAWPPKEKKHPAWTQMANVPGVRLHSNIRQEELAREMLQSSILVYPCDFMETCSNVVLEAQAAGCPVVTTNLASMSEVVGEAGVLIEGRPGNAEYDHLFVEAVDKLLSDDNLYSFMQEKAKEKILGATWYNRAGSLLEYLRAYHGLG